ncbi:hypothetical protein, partial [Streptomyces sp. NPDC003996]
MALPKLARRGGATYSTALARAAAAFAAFLTLAAALTTALTAALSLIRHLRPLRQNGRVLRRSVVPRARDGPHHAVMRAVSGLAHG